jgi:hypothetical protein
VRWALVVVLASGCVYQELTTPHVEPGGTVTAIIGNGMPRTSTGLGDATKDPFSLSGYSPYLTFGLVAPGSMMALTMNNVAIEVDVPSAQLEVHADGSGCAAQSAVIHLHTDGNGNLGGDFTATGTVPNATDACTFTGTLDSIPISR